MAFSTFKELDDIKSNTYQGFQSLSSVKRPPRCLETFKALLFLSFVQKRNIFLPRKKCRCRRATLAKMSHLHFNLQLVVWKKPFHIKRAFLVELFWCFFLLFCFFFSIFSIKIPPILVNTSPQSYSKSIPAVNNYVLLHVILSNFAF